MKTADCLITAPSDKGITWEVAGEEDPWRDALHEAARSLEEEGHIVIFNADGMGFEWKSRRSAVA